MSNVILIQTELATTVDYLLSALYYHMDDLRHDDKGNYYLDQGDDDYTFIGENIGDAILYMDDQLSRFERNPL